MDTPAASINPRAMRAVDIVDNAAFSKRRAMRANDPFPNWCGETHALANQSFEIYLDIVRKRVSAPAITVQPLVSIGDREFELPPKKEAVIMSIQKFNLREWLVPPILVPAFLGLLIAGAVIIRW
jgi:hypothetical protein